MDENLPIKSWAEADRPREKMLEKGRQALSDAELLAILIGSGSRNETAVELARRILLACNNSLHELSTWSLTDLMKFKGMGEAKAVSVMAALELGRRKKESQQEKRSQLHTSADSYRAAADLFQDLPHEEFWMLLLTRSHKLIRREFISRGGLSGTFVDPKMIFKAALQYLASGIILCHNHPSGSLHPSDADRGITARIRDAGRLLEIEIVDHLIFASNSYFSFADNGLL
ncbi:MAG TPA: DNA repair protein RadC [Bacteroidia bacterium]|jgi:DNA repair protein RadC|nr:DNA repair protein RadC [Bacteroidia bacterium]